MRPSRRIDRESEGRYVSIFPLEPNFFYFQKHPFQAFLVSKTYIFIHVKKNFRTRPLRMQFFYVLPKNKKINCKPTGGS